MANQSTQESVLEQLAQHSFGASSIYSPSKYLRGVAPKEPADLAWISCDVVALFYLTQSRTSVGKQLDHNLNQARGYLRLWASLDQRFRLRGQNRFGDRCDLTYSSESNLLVFSVVSADAPITFGTIHVGKRRVPYAVVTDSLVGTVAHVGGTMADLLAVTLAASDVQPLNGQWSASIAQVASRYFAENAPAEKTPFHQPGDEWAQIRRICGWLRYLRTPRIPDPEEPVPFNRSNAAYLAGLLGDFTMREMTAVGACVAAALARAEAPSFSKTVTATTRIREDLDLLVVAESCAAGVEPLRQTFSRINRPTLVLLYSDHDPERWEAPTFSAWKGLPGPNRALSLLKSIQNLAVGGTARDCGLTPRSS